jgi:hypothetical protein
LDAALGGVSDYLNVNRGTAHGGYIKVFGPSANSIGSTNSITVTTTNQARCAVYHVAGQLLLNYPMQNSVSPNESYQATQSTSPTGVYAGIASQLKVYVNDSTTAAYGLNDSVVVLCLGVESLSQPTGAPLDGSDAVWS